VTHREFEEIFREHKDAVYRFAWRMTADASAAEDVSQEVFVALLRHPDRFDPARGSLRTFLLAVARNLSLKRWRSERRFGDFDDWDELEERHDGAQPQIMESAEIGTMVADAVRSLPPLQREVLILAEYEELTLKEIAGVVEAEVGTVKSRLHRARENLCRALAPLKSRRVRG
jgi:RNA polymerase sigma-70 factor, ECF subfamily